MTVLALPCHSRHATRLLWRFGIIIVLVTAWTPCSIAQQNARTKESGVERKTTGKKAVVMNDGRRQFETRCSACHGLDGRGGEHGPNISTNEAARQRSDDDLFKIIHDGISAKGMPAFDYLRDAKIKSMVRYLRYLDGQGGADSLRGNSLRGKALFFGKTECGDCHMIRGKGGFLASDLTEYAQSHAPRAFKEAILNPAKFRVHDVEMVEIKTRSGERLVGAIRNEDNFSLQLLGANGAFHLVMKSEVEQLTRSASGLMPTDNGHRLSASELEDLVSFLSEGTRAPTRKSAGINRDRHPNAMTGKSPNK